MQIKEAYSKISKGISIERFTLENVLPSKLASISRLSAHNKTRYGSLRTRNARGKKINNDTVCHGVERHLHIQFKHTVRVSRLVERAADRWVDCESRSN